MDEVRSEKFTNIPSIKFGALMDAQFDLFPSLSKRQYIFDYLDRIGVHNEKIRKYIHHKLYLNDYMTDEEMQRDMPKVFNQIQKLRTIYDYNDTKMQFDAILDKFTTDKDSLRCPYCKAYVQEKKKHIKYCQDAIIEFNMDKEKFIKSYIRANFKVEELKDGEEEDAIYYFKSKDFKTLTRYIGVYFKSHKKAIEAIENNDYKEKKKPIKSLSVFDKQKFLNDFKKEFEEYAEKNNLFEEKKPIEVSKKVEKIDENSEEIDTQFYSLNNIKKVEVLIQNTPVKKNEENNEQSDYKISETGQKFLESVKYKPMKKPENIKFITHL